MSESQLLEPGYYEIEFHDDRRILLQVTADDPKYGYLGELGIFVLDPNDPNSEWDQVRALHRLGVAVYNLPIPQPVETR